MKFILLHLEHSLLLLLPTKTKQPPIVHLSNYKNKEPQDEEEFCYTKYQNIIQLIDYQTLYLELMLDELILSFNSLNGPFSQMFSRLLGNLVLHNLFNILSYLEITHGSSQINHNIQQMIILSKLDFRQFYKHFTNTYSFTFSQ